MTRTLILIFHPNFAASKANAALAREAETVAGTELVDMQSIYPSGDIDADVEVARLLSADRIVLQFPMQWYSTPPLLKAWQDAVLTRMFYIAHATEGRLLEGTPLLVAVTAGNLPEAYMPSGANLFSVEDLLRPLEATANRCGLPWAQPFIVFRANKLTEEAARSAGRGYARRLREWQADPSGVLFDTHEPSFVSAAG